MTIYMVNIATGKPQLVAAANGNEAIMKFCNELERVYGKRYTYRRATMAGTAGDHIVYINEDGHEETAATVRSYHGTYYTVYAIAYTVIE